MSEFFSPLYDNGLDTRSNSLITNELLVKDPLTDEYKPIIPNEGGGGAVRPYYTTDTEIDFGIDKTKITQSQISLGGPSVSAMKKTILKSGELDVTDDAGNNAKIAGGAIYYKKASLEGEEENPTVTMPYEDIGEVVDKIKPIDYLNNGNINFSDKGLGYRIIMSETSSNTGLQMKSDLLQIGPRGSAVAGIRAYLKRDSLLFRGATTGDFTDYRNKEIHISNPLDGEKILNLEDLLTSQENYLKPDKLEFANGSGLSADGLSYKEGASTITKTIKEVVDVVDKIKPITTGVEISGADILQFKNGNILSQLNAINFTLRASSTTVNLLTIARNMMRIVDSSTAMYGEYKFDRITSQLSGQPQKELILSDISDAQANYLKPDKIEFADGSGLSADGLSYKEGSTTITKTIKEVLDAVDNSSGGTTYGYLTNDGIRTTGTQSITHKINSGDSLNRYSLTSNRIHHQSRVAVGNNPSSGYRLEIQPDRIYLYEESGEFSGFYKDHIRYLKGGEVKSLNYDAANKAIDKVNTGYIKTSFWNSRGTSKIFWIGNYEKALETTYGFLSSNIIQFTEHAVRNSGKLLFRMWYNDSQFAYSSGEIVKFIFRVQKPTTTPEGSSVANKSAMITAHICDVPRSTYASSYSGVPFEVVSVGPSLHGEDVEDIGSISFDNEYYAYYTLKLRALRTITAGQLDFTMMFQFHGYLGDYGTMPTSMYVTT